MVQRSGLYYIFCKYTDLKIGVFSIKKQDHNVYYDILDSNIS